MKELVFHLIEAYGYPGLFVMLILGIVGLPVPDELILAFTGYMAYLGDLSLLPSIATAFAGSVCGITISYTLGSTLGFYLVERYGYLVHLDDARLAQTRGWFNRFGKWALPVAYFVPGFRHVVAYIAGATKFSLRVFVLFAYTGGLLWSCSFILLGYYVGEDWQRLMEELRGHLVVAAGMLFTALLFYLLTRNKRQESTDVPGRRRKHRSAAAGSRPDNHREEGDRDD